MPRPQKQTAVGPRYAPRPCEECGVTLTPKDWRQKLHPECAERRQQHHVRNWRRKMGQERKRTKKRPTVTLATDFLLALPEMRAAMARSAFDGFDAFDCGRDNDPREIGYGGRRRND
jgi:hypothetical protein